MRMKSHVISWEDIHPKPKNIQQFFARCGRAGGKKAARNMTPGERKARAKLAVEAREAKRKLSPAKKGSWF